MAKRVKPTKPGGRGGGRVTPKASSRYTPPVPREQKVSPKIVPILMFTFLGLGMLTILLNYVGLLPGGAKNGYLIIGLVLITAGFITATQYH
jgi:Cell division protein CrgA